MGVHNQQYLWTNKELVIRLFCPSGTELGDVSTTKSIGRFERSETATQVGQVTGSVGVFSATSGVNKSDETVRPVFQNHGLVHEDADDAPHYRASFDMAKITPPIGEGYEQYSIEWKIVRIQDIARHFEVQVQLGHVVKGVFEKEYAHLHNAALVVDEEDALRQPLSHVLAIINNRLNASHPTLNK
jgi:hypothetical protein